jgi:hypothetical protein
MTPTSCVNTGSEAHDPANATFEEAASQLEEQDHSHKIISDGVIFLRESVVEEYDPSARTAAADFLGLSGSVELGSLDQVMDVTAYRGFNRCPVLWHSLLEEQREGQKERLKPSVELGVGATAGMRTSLPPNLLPMSKDAES